MSPPERQAVPQSFGSPWLAEPFGRSEDWPEEAASRFCWRLARSHYENFPVVAGLFGREQRRALAALYSFARTADDFADEPAYSGYGLALLKGWREHYLRALDGYPAPAAIEELVWAVDRFGLDPSWPMDLLDAFEQDCRKSRYEDWRQLLDYCRLSANPVGRSVLAIMEQPVERLSEYSDNICTALQLTNHWQDLSRDIPRGRLYVPLELLRRFDIDERTLMQGKAARGFEPLLRHLVERTRQMFRKGMPLARLVGWRYRPYIAAVLAGGLCVLDMVSRSGTEILSKRPAVTPLGMLKWLRDGALSALRKENHS